MVKGDRVIITNMEGYILCKNGSYFIPNVVSRKRRDYHLSNLDRYGIIIDSSVDKYGNIISYCLNPLDDCKYGIHPLKPGHNHGSSWFSINNIELDKQHYRNKIIEEIING